MTANGLDDPRAHEYRAALANINAGLRGSPGAHERYRHALGPYLELMAELANEGAPIHRRTLMAALCQAGLPLGAILIAFRATRDERAYVEDHPPVVVEPVDEQERLALMPWRVYLTTPHWRTVRADALRRAGERCALCNSGVTLQVHHRDYTRRGAERPADVIVLCDDCRSRHHGKLKVA